MRFLCCCAVGEYLKLFLDFRDVVIRYTKRVRADYEIHTLLPLAKERYHLGLNSDLQLTWLELSRLL